MPILFNDSYTVGDPGDAGAYDPVEQIWKSPAGVPRTDPMAYTGTDSYSVIDHMLIIDDAHVD